MKKYKYASDGMYVRTRLGRDSFPVKYAYRIFPIRLPVLVWVLLCVVCMFSVSLAKKGVASMEQPLSIQKIIDKEGSFSFTDGSSIYTFKEDGDFSLHPKVSGRLVQGTWRTEDFRRFVIVGTWSWADGLSKVDDFRELILYVNRHPGESTETDISKTIKLYPVYFAVEKLIELPEDEYRKKVSRPGGFVESKPVPYPNEIPAKKKK